MPQGNSDDASHAPSAPTRTAGTATTSGGEASAHVRCRRVAPIAWRDRRSSARRAKRRSRAVVDATDVVTSTAAAIAIRAREIASRAAPTRASGSPDSVTAPIRASTPGATVDRSCSAALNRPTASDPPDSRTLTDVEVGERAVGFVERRRGPRVEVPGQPAQLAGGVGHAHDPQRGGFRPGRGVGPEIDRAPGPTVLPGAGPPPRGRPSTR